MIPESKTAIVKNTLLVTFGTDEIEDIKELTAGLSSAVVYRIVVKGKAYLLRIIMREDVLGSLVNQYANMRAAAEAGIAPNVWYTGIDDKISITDFIEAKAFPIDDARKLLPDLLKRLHALPPFPFQINYLDVMDGVVKRFQGANNLQQDIAGEIFSRYEEIKNIYPGNREDMVSCHNDTKADNILFDGERAWLVDWEAAFLNDRYHDLAVVANFIIWSDDDEKEYLSNYFGGVVNEYRHARFFLMRQLLHLIYAAFLLVGHNAPAMPDPAMTRPGFREFHDLLWAGKINIGNPESRQQYALVHLDQLRNNMRLKRWNESLKIVSEFTVI